MTLFFPLVFTGLFLAFGGFIAGDLGWVSHLMAMQGGGWEMWRAIVGVGYLLGLFGAFGLGVTVDCGS